MSPEAENLYGLPLERFVPERTVLARSLRADGRPEEAAAVAGARKPSLAAWAVNQLVRTQAAVVKDLFAAGDDLRRAQSELLSGCGERPALRAAGDRERAAVDRLLDAARGLLTADGHELSGTVVDRVADTLHAAALDPDARGRVRAGVLERELRHVGLGDTTAAPPAARPQRRVAAQPEAVESSPAKPKRAKDAAERRERAQAAAGKAAAAAAAEAKAGRRSEAAARALEAAQAQREQAGRTLEQADAALATAQAQREQAGRALEQADAALAMAQAKAAAAAEAHRGAQADRERA